MCVFIPGVYQWLLAAVGSRWSWGVSSQSKLNLSNAVINNEACKKKVLKTGIRPIKRAGVVNVRSASLRAATPVVGVLSFTISSQATGWPTWFKGLWEKMRTNLYTAEIDYYLSLLAAYLLTFWFLSSAKMATSGSPSDSLLGFWCLHIGFGAY